MSSFCQIWKSKLVCKFGDRSGYRPHNNSCQNWRIWKPVEKGVAIIYYNLKLITKKTNKNPRKKIVMSTPFSCSSTYAPTLCLTYLCALQLWSSTLLFPLHLPLPHDIWNEIMDPLDRLLMTLIPYSLTYSTKRWWKSRQNISDRQNIIVIGPCFMRTCR